MPPPVLSLPKYLLMSEDCQCDVCVMFVAKKKFACLTPTGCSALDMVKDVFGIKAASLHLQLLPSNGFVTITHLKLDSVRGTVATHDGRKLCVNN